MNGELVGRWSVDAQGVHHFQYDDSWIGSPLGRPISLSMALTNRKYSGPVVKHYFDNLLPDNQKIRERIQQRFGAKSQTSFDLLAGIGRDCVGALQLLPDGDSPGDFRRIEGEALSEAQIEGILTHIPVFGRYQDDDEFRISLAGAQEKTALLLHAGAWKKPLGATPTTHILKLPIGHHGHGGIDLTTSVENEWLCAQILKAYGVPVADCWPAKFGQQAVLVVERFDRRISADGKWLIRLPQEDMCQAKGVSAAAKYENEGGPGIESIMNLLLGSSDAELDRQDFFRTQVIFWLLCAIDGHAKNFSIFIEPRGGFRLTPRYDVMSAYPVVGNAPQRIPEKKLKMAMALHGKNAHYKWSEIKRRHFNDLAKHCGFEAPGKRIVRELVERTPAIVEAVSAGLPQGFPATVADPILVGLKATALRLARETE
ncbi:type II toxin-antitoxin system HipA family toxin [Georgfuchsia toluolica]|nr:type II toxin-antitoxin system HipA family toxin [Georgfuchsia toluolica]